MASDTPRSPPDAPGHDLHPTDAASAGLERNGHDPDPKRRRPDEYRERRIGGTRTPFTHLWMNRIGDEASRILPDNQSDLIVSSTGRAWLVGPATGVEVTELTPGTTLRGVRIGTAWLRPIVGVEATELTDRHLAFDELFSARLARRLADALWAGRFDDELARLLWPRAEADGRVAYAVRALASSGAPAVGVLAESIGVSARHLRRLVERETGLPPKLIHQVARLRRTIDHAASGTHVDIAQLAVAAGYSDQAHFAREARRFSGLTPTALVGRR